MNATVTVSLADIDDLRNHVRESEKRENDLKDALRNALVASPDGRIKELYDAIQIALPIIRFACANCAPEAVRGWPHAALYAFGERLQKIPGATDLDLELGLDLMSLAREIKPFEDARAAGVKITARTGSGSDDPLAA